MTLPPDLQYAVSGGWLQVEEWMDFLFDLGEAMGRRCQQGEARVVAVALPTSAYAAAFAALGAVTSQSKVVVPRERFRLLQNLPSGTPLLVQEGGRQLYGLFAGPETVAGRDFLKVRVENEKGGNTTVFLSEERVGDIRRAGAVSRKLPANQKGYKMKGPSGFARRFLGARVEQHMSTSRIDCLIIGSRAGLKQEICGEFLSFRRDRRGADAGTLQEIIRIKSFKRSSENYRADVAPTNGRATDIGDGKPSMVIFDGALPFLKRHAEFPGTDWLILLDRTEARCQDAVMGLMEKYVNRHAGSTEGPVNRLSLPAGCEILEFRRG